MKEVSFLAIVLSNLADIFSEISQGSMNTFVFTAGVGSVNKFRLKNRFQKIVKQMMNNPIAETGGKNFSQSRFSDNKTD